MKGSAGIFRALVGGRGVLGGPASAHPGPWRTTTALFASDQRGLPWLHGNRRRAAHHGNGTSLSYYSTPPTQPDSTTTKGASQWAPELIVFDKHGTLINLHAIWGPWVQELIHRLEGATGFSLEAKLYHRLDICVFTKKVKAGVVGEGTTSQIKHAVEDVLVGEGLSWRQAQVAVDKHWMDWDMDEERSRCQLVDLRSMFENIKSRGMKIAVSTSDDRVSTERSLRRLRLLDHVDSIVCGDDVTSGSAHPDKLLRICKDLQIAPEKSVLIGDTPDDIRMGREAQLALCVGVLTGIGTRLDLGYHADFVVEDVQQAVHEILTMNPERLRSLSGDVTARHSRNKASLVIFDKDGTLIDFHSFWTPWAMKMIGRLEAVTGLTLRRRLLDELGYCHQTNKWRPGLFAEGTTSQNQDKIVEILLEEGLSRSSAEGILSQAWQPGDQSTDNSELQPLDNPTQLFALLQRHGVKVAVCTADSRLATENFLRSMGAMEHVDMLVCGDDPGTEPKPSGHNALKICRALGVDTEGTVVVGDTQADLGMGRSAKLGATVGVLSGVGRVDDLRDDSDHVVPSIKHVLELVLGKGAASRGLINRDLLAVVESAQRTR